MSKISKYIVSIIAFIVLIGAISYIGTYSNWFQDEFKSFYVSYDGAILKSNDEIMLNPYSDNTFNVGYSLDLTASGYSIEITPNSALNFNFTTSDKYYRFGSLGDLSDCFNITYDNTNFTISSESILMSDILAKLGYTVVSADVTYADDYYFSMIIYNNDKSASVSVNFGVSTVDMNAVVKVDIDTEVVIL